MLERLRHFLRVQILYGNARMLAAFPMKARGTKWCSVSKYSSRKRDRTSELYLMGLCSYSSNVPVVHSGMKRLSSLSCFEIRSPRFHWRPLGCNTLLLSVRPIKRGWRSGTNGTNTHIAKDDNSNHVCYFILDKNNLWGYYMTRHGGRAQKLCCSSFPYFTHVMQAPNLYRWCWQL